MDKITKLAKNSFKIVSSDEAADLLDKAMQL